MANELDALKAENQRLIKLEGALRRSCETLKVIAQDKEDGLVAENAELQRKFDGLMETAIRKNEELKKSKEGILHETLDAEYVVCMTEEKWAEVKKENERLREDCLWMVDMFASIQLADKTPEYEYGSVNSVQEKPSVGDRWMTPKEISRMVTKKISERITGKARASGEET